ncbi:uncharacterized protein TNCV_3878201 [Trichonephila clavipes]|nr:uncharacterized protein TNCV_3878201 [Trichonephila clavipes]
MRGFLKERGESLDLANVFPSPNVMTVQGLPWSLASFAKESAHSFSTRFVSARKTTVRLLNAPRQAVSDAICRFKELGNDGRRPGSGRKRTVNTSKNRTTIEKRVQRNPRVCLNQIAHDME